MLKKIIHVNFQIQKLFLITKGKPPPPLMLKTFPTFFFSKLIFRYIIDWSFITEFFFFNNFFIGRLKCNLIEEKYEKYDEEKSVYGKCTLF